MKKTVATLLMATALAACGGGGGGGGGSGTPLTIDVPDPIRPVEEGISSTSAQAVEISDISRSALEATNDEGNAILHYVCQGRCGDKGSITRRLPRINILDEREVLNALKVDRVNNDFNQYLFRGRAVISGQNFTFENFGVWMEHSVFGELALFDENTFPNATILYSFGDISDNNPSGTTGGLVWNGVSYVIEKVDIQDRERDAHDVYHVGSVRVDIDDISNPDVDVEITDITPPEGINRLDNQSWMDMPLQDDHTGFRSEDSTMIGTFYGPEHEEVGGVFNRNGIEGVFGAIKEE